ncbi:hypothetical protein MMC15_006527 [Xylographa vitiligo]|nr:hypothetical protein [Xylographa vitiligo]
MPGRRKYRHHLRTYTSSSNITTNSVTVGSMDDAILNGHGDGRTPLGWRFGQVNEIDTSGCESETDQQGEQCQRTDEEESAKEHEREEESEDKSDHDKAMVQQEARELRPQL